MAAVPFNLLQPVPRLVSAQYVSYLLEEPVHLVFGPFVVSWLPRGYILHLSLWDVRTVRSNPQTFSSVADITIDEIRAHGADLQSTVEERYAIDHM